LISITEIRDILSAAPIATSVGAVVIVVYMAAHLTKGQHNKINLANVITVFATGFSLTPGLSVLLAGFETDSPSKGIEQSYFFLGGFAVIYVGVQEIYKRFKDI
jgi:small neutral amino acid transporter SnatA (MarC family)